MYSAGSTIIAGINTAKSSESSHSNTSMTKDATGTDFMILTGNHINASIKLLIEAKIAKIIPIIPPIIKPVQICTREVKRLVQKISDGSKSWNKTFKTLDGVGKKISLSIIEADTCHIHIHIKMERL